MADRRFALILFEAFGFPALFLAATGIYGVLSPRHGQIRQLGRDQVHHGLRVSPVPLLAIATFLPAEPRRSHPVTEIESVGLSPSDAPVDGASQDQDLAGAVSLICSLPGS